MPEHIRQSYGYPKSSKTEMIREHRVVPYTGGQTYRHLGHFLSSFAPNNSSSHNVNNQGLNPLTLSSSSYHIYTIIH